MRTLNARTPLVRFRHPLVFTMGLLSLIAVGSTLLATRQAGKETPVAQLQDIQGVPVHTATVTQESLQLRITAAGRVEAYSSTSVNSDVDGQLTSLHFTDGQYVKKGEPLFAIDSRFLQGDLDDEARTDQSEVADQQGLVKADLEQDEAQAKAAEAEAEKCDALFKDGVISKEEDERTRKIADELGAAVKADREAMAGAQEPVNVGEVGALSPKAQGYSSIRSPIDGLTRNLVAKQGDRVIVRDVTPLVVIDQVTPIYISFGVPGTRLPDINRCISQGELEVAATIGSTRGNDEGQTETGTLGPTDLATIGEDGTAALKATFDNKDRRLRPGQAVNIVLTLRTAPDDSVIPSSALQSDEEGQYVFVVKSDRSVEERPVVVEETVGDKAILTRGLESGEVVVTDAQSPLCPVRGYDEEKGRWGEGERKSERMRRRQGVKAERSLSPPPLLLPRGATS